MAKRNISNKRIVFKIEKSLSLEIWYIYIYITYKYNSKNNYQKILIDKRFVWGKTNALNYHYYDILKQERDI